MFFCISWLPQPLKKLHFLKFRSYMVALPLGLADQYSWAASSHTKDSPASTISPDDCNRAFGIHTIKDSLALFCLLSFPLSLFATRLQLLCQPPLTHQYSRADLHQHKGLSDLHHHCIGLITLFISLPCASHLSHDENMC